MDNSEELLATINVLQQQRNAAYDLHARSLVVVSILQKEIDKIKEELTAAKLRVAELTNHE